MVEKGGKCIFDSINLVNLESVLGENVTEKGVVSFYSFLSCRTGVKGGNDRERVLPFVLLL